MPDELVLYVKKTCPWCVEAERFLDQHGYAYREVDVLQNSASFAEMRQLSGQGYVPTLVVGAKILADFGTPELENFLRTENLLPTKKS